MAKILILDDEERIHFSVTSVLEPMGHTVKAVSKARETLQMMDSFSPEIAIIQAENGGIEMLPILKEKFEKTKVIMTVSTAKKEVALQALRNGATDMLIKPLSVKDFVGSVGRCMNDDLISGDSPHVSKTSTSELPFILPLYGNSSHAVALRNVLDDLKEEKQRLPILIHGAPGAFKREFANLLHGMTGDKSAETHYFDCAEASEEDIRRMLVNEKGELGRLFRDLKTDTVILDRIESLNEEIQDELANVIQDVVKNVLLICIADENVDEKLDNGEFSLSFYFRISAKNILFEPLLRRKEDINEMIAALLQYSSMMPDFCRTTEFPDEVIDILREYEWPENYAELEQVITLAAMEAKGGKVSTQKLKRRLIKK